METATRIRSSRALVAAATCLALIGCAGNGQGLDANGDPSGAANGGPLAADLASIQENIFTPICSVCHAGAAAPQGLRLDTADSYNLLIGVPSTEVPSVQRVKVGDPADSYIIQKLEGHAAVGARMPFGGPYLTNEQIAVIALWISNGAPRAAAAAVTADAALPTLVVSAPGANETLFDPPPQIMLGFDRDLNEASANSLRMRLERISTDSEAAPIVVALRDAIAQENPRALLLWPHEPLPAGHYRVVLGGAAELEPALRAPAALEFDVVERSE